MKDMRNILVVLTLAVASANIGASATAPKLRLSEVQQATPTGYQATLKLNPSEETFTGTIRISLTLASTTKTLWLNQSKLQISSAIATAPGKKSLTAKILPGGDDFAGFAFPSSLPKGPLTLEITYSGEISSKSSSGIFRQKDGSNWYLFTQFEPTDARAAFPCFDEPNYKTPWQITLHIPANITAVGNTNIVSDKVNGTERTVVFAKTQPLPSYLVAFAAGPFEYVPAGNAGAKQVPVRIIVPKGHADEAKYAAEVTADIINHHEKYFGIPYPYEKADQLVIPDTSGFGAMENAGLITYAQNIILAKPESDSINRRRDYARTAAHELAHQWFGNLVTSAWWDDIWLNESFATWMEDKLLAEWKPEWNTAIDEVDAKLNVASQDSLISARQIRQPILAKDDINSAFDGISYQKGGAVIAMFENWLGEAEFQKAIVAYLKRYSDRAATAGDLLDALSSSTKKDITRAFSTFLNQPGIPLLSIDLHCKPGNTTLHLEQQRFLPLGSKGSAKQTWSFPVCISYEENGKIKRECTLLTEAKFDWKLNTAACPAWLNPNDGAKGYYRTELRGKLLEALAAHPEVLSAREQIDLMGNAAALGEAGKLSLDQTLTLAAKFANDPQRQVLQASIQIVGFPAGNLLSVEQGPAFARFLRSLYATRARQLSWTPRPGEPEDDALLRQSLVPLLATYGQDEVLASQARQLADAWLAGQASPDANLLGSILRAAAFNGDKALHARYLAKLEGTTDKANRSRILGALSDFRDPAALRAGMDILASGKIPFIEASGLLFAGQTFPETRRLAFDFLKVNFDTIVKLMPTGGGFDFGSVLPDVGSSFCDIKSRNELESFFTPKVAQFTGAPNALKQTLETIDLCIASKAAQQPGFDKFLEKY